MIYLDNAATSFPKPPRVIEEMARCMREYCGNPGRGSHKLALAAAEKIYDCRVTLSDFFHADAPENVVFCQNATHALNIAILSLARKGAHFICSDMEHNSVRRPLEYLAREQGCSYSVFNSYVKDPERNAQKICSSITSLIRPDTVAVISTACPNVCSARMPLDEIGALCRRAGIFFIVDGAQGAGHFEIDMKRSDISALALPGHKGLLGPQGSGVLILSDDFKSHPLLYGGSGSASLDPDMPTELPERLEAGTLSTPAIVGLEAGIGFLKGIGIEKISNHEKTLCTKAVRMLSEIPGVTVYAPRHAGSVVSFNIGTLSSDKTANLLSERGICVRGGFHCNPMAHSVLGSDTHGSVRTSFSPFNTADDVFALAEEVRAIARGKYR
ncbi:MAG: aminotransferase class V-fold PLP-dependent enzyme [Clostridia bacterium]|nr:aminotransferase class V-fold PLP-dependent enzyme [Clostridia bacterium]